MAASKAKGKRGERDIAGLLSEWTGLAPSHFQPSRSGKKEADIGLSEEAKRVWPYHTEVKFEETPRFLPWIEQAINDAPLVSEGREPIVVYKHRRTVFVLTRLVHLNYLIAKAEWLDQLAQAERTVLELCIQQPRELPWVSVPFAYFVPLVTGRD